MCRVLEPYLIPQTSMSRVLVYKRRGDEGTDPNALPLTRVDMVQVSTKASVWMDKLHEWIGLDG